MAEVAQLIKQWEFYAVVAGSVLVWYGLAVLIAHIVDGSTQDAASASITGVTVAMVLAMVASGAVAVYWLDASLSGGIAAAGATFLVCLIFVAIGSRSRK